MATLITKQGVFSTIAVLLIAMVGLPALVVAQDFPGEGDAAFADQQRVLLKTTKVDIDKKTPEVVISNVHDRFGVDDGTLIIGLDGKQVSYREMLVPCTVTIDYAIEEGGNRAEMIKILRISPNATRHFFYERPQ